MTKKTRKTFVVSGRVVEQDTGIGLKGLLIEAWDKDLIWDDLVGSTYTNADGYFKMQFDSSYFQEIFIDRQPDLFFKVFYGDVLIKSTEESVLWNVKAGESEIIIELILPDLGTGVSPRIPDQPQTLPMVGLRPSQPPTDYTVFHP